MKYLFYFVFFGLTMNNTLALSLLPRNAYLRLGDNERSVKILQEILNSNPSTILSQDGPGSPGNEGWYFGVLTEEALGKFQEEQNLEVTGRIDFKTWKALNDYVESKDPTLKDASKSDNKINKSDIEKITKKISEQNKADFEDVKKVNSEQKSDPIVEPETTQPKSYIQSLIDKYSGFFYVNKGDAKTSSQGQNSFLGGSPTVDTYSNSYSAKTPYLNTDTGIYSSNPSYAQQSKQQPANNSFSSPSNPFLPQQPNPYANNGNSNPVPNFLNGVIQGLESSAGKVAGDRGDIGQCRATSFAHATFAEGCVADRADQQNGQRSASGVILSRSGVPAIPAVALPKSGKFGDAVEVKDMRTGKCKAFPLLDRGPGSGPLSKGVCIDLTGSAIDILSGRQPCKNVGALGEGKIGIPMVQYAIIPGEKIQPGQTKECTHLVKQ